MPIISARMAYNLIMAYFVNSNYTHKTKGFIYNMEQKFKIGDVVRLKSGGPKMTVSENVIALDDKFYGIVRCEWFSGLDNRSATFQQEILDLD